MDFRFAWRSLRRTPGFAVLAILILALGVGANTAIFSVVRGVVLRPLAYRDASRLVSISMVWKGGGKFGQVSGPDFLDFEAQSTAFESMAVYADDVLSVVANGRSEFAGASSVSQHFLRTLGVEPVAGRAFSAADFTGKPSVAMVSAAFWERHYGDVRFSSGHVLKAAGVEVEIVGILPAGFHFPESSKTDVWTPLFEVLKDTNRGAHNYHALGRLKAGVSLAQAQAQISSIAGRLEKQYPGTNKETGAYVTTLTNFTVRRVKTTLYILLGAVGLVLLIACANIANLLLARGMGRSQELAIRSALGASRGRLVRQLFTETMLLAAAGCLGGLVLAKAVLPVLLALAPKYVPRLEQVNLDWVALAFCMCAGLFASILFGLAPALQGSRADPNRDLRGSGARGVVRGAGGRARTIFVAAEIALCMVLLVSAGLLLRSFSAMLNVDLGFRPEKLLVAHVSVPSGDAASATQKVFNPLLERVAGNRAVRAAAITRGLPSDMNTRSNGDYIITGQTLDDLTAVAPQAGMSVVSGDYFRALGTPLVAGRSFSERDTGTAPRVAIVNRALVRRSFPHVDPIGKKVLCGLDAISMKWMTIVGVVGDAHLDGPTEAPMPEIYMPYLQHPQSDFNIVVKAAGVPLALVQPVREDVAALDSEASVKFTTMENQLGESLATPRFGSTLVAAFAGLATLLAAIGIYGLISYSVKQRTAEIGIRMALGADRAKVVRMVITESLRVTGLGLVIGSAGALAAAQLLRSQLFEVSPEDPAIYLGMFVLLALVAIAASYLPARRAARIEPLEALRQE